MSITTDAQQNDYPVMDVDLYDPALLDNPWPTLKLIREAGAVVWNKRGFWMTGRDRVIRRVLTRAGPLGQEGMVSAFFGKDAFISMDDKRAHNELRNVWASAFGRDGVAALVPFVRETTTRLLDAVESQLLSGAEVDIVGALCRRLPAYVISHMMGVSDDMIGQVVEWSDLMADATAGGFPIDYDNDPAWLAGENAKADLAAFLIEQIRYRRVNPGTDLISRIVHSEVGQRLSEEAILMNTRQLIFAGNETTAKWLAHIFGALGQRADVRNEILGDRALLPNALEEIFRRAGITQVLPRGVNADDVVVEGVALPRGSEILLLLGAASRDPERFENPDDVDIRRQVQPHLGFGFGLHTCLGAVLARMEAAEVSSVFLDRFPQFDITRPLRYGNFSVWGPTQVWIKLST